jgi:predicted phosphodiesterase
LRFAVLSDVHGNALALDAVLEDVAGQGVDDILCLGDHVTGPVDPAGAAERLMAVGALCISGNHDRWTADPTLQRAGAIDRFAARRLAAAQRDWLAGLPATATYADVAFLCHGTPDSDEAIWLDRFFNGRKTELPSEVDVAVHAAGLDFPVLLCGHTHVPRSVRLRDGRLIVNPGSVGMQLVRGTPDAHYAIIERRPSGWRVGLHTVPYDHHAAALRAANNGFPQWAESLVAGWAGPESLA